MFGGTIIAGYFNDILCCLNGVDCVWRYNKAGYFNDNLCCLNCVECVWRYNNSGAL